MKEITFKFESEHDYQNFIDCVIMPDLEQNDTINWDKENNILILKDTSIQQLD